MLFFFVDAKDIFASCIKLKCRPKFRYRRATLVCQLLVRGVPYFCNITDIGIQTDFMDDGKDYSPYCRLSAFPEASLAMDMDLN